jgi:hypothetical protein
LSRHEFPQLRLDVREPAFCTGGLRHVWVLGSAAPHDTPRIAAVVDQLALPNRVAPRPDRVDEWNLRCQAGNRPPAPVWRPDPVLVPLTGQAGDRLTGLARSGGISPSQNGIGLGVSSHGNPRWHRRDGCALPPANDARSAGPSGASTSAFGRASPVQSYIVRVPCLGRRPS